MRIMKSKYGSTMTDDHLEVCLRLDVSCYCPDYASLAGSIQCKSELSQYDRMEPISIKMEDVTSKPPETPLPQHSVYNAQYSQYIAHQHPLENPGQEVQGYMPPNVPYQCVLPPEQYQMYSMEGGSCLPDYFGYIPDATQNNNVPVGPMSANVPQPAYRRATASDLSVGYQQTPDASSSYLGGDGTSAHGSKLTTDAAVKKELRLKKNREAARECRRKKKEYFKYLESRVAELESQKKILMDELRAIKQFYRIQ